MAIWVAPAKLPLGYLIEPRCHHRKKTSVAWVARGRFGDNLENIDQGLLETHY